MSSDQSIFHKKVISEATSFVEFEENCVNNSISKFDKNALIGLWWDAKGFWNVSDKGYVLDCMQVYRQINKGMLNCIELVANDDDNAYQKIIDFYETIEQLKTVAMSHTEQKSKALCNLAKKFLDDHMKLDYHLKRVEIFMLEKQLRGELKTVSDMNKTFEQRLNSFDTILKDNQKLEKLVENFERDNQNFKQRIEKLLTDNKDLLNSIQETNATADRRIAEMREMNKRDVEETVKNMLDEKFGLK